MIRATTGGVMRTYRSSLMNSFINMNNNRNTVLTQRTFNSFAEDPGAAAKAFRLRKSRMTVESQYAICTDAMRKYQQAVSCLQSIDDVLCTKEGEYGYYMKTLTGTTLSMLNDPEGDARTQLAKVLDQMSREVIQTMNQKYGDNFIFAGADGHNVPFEIVGDKLYYRGVPVDAAMPNVLEDENGFVMVNENGEVDPAGEFYLKMNNVTAIPADEFDLASYTAPGVVEDADGPVAYAYDAETDTYAQSAGGGWYKLDPPNADGTEYISVSDYEDAVERANSLLRNADGTPYAQVDENGNPTAYYVVNGERQTMTPEQYETAVLDSEKLQYLAGETQFVDIGYGFQEDPVTGKLIETSAFDAALNGINFLGYGLDEDGDPRNIYSLVQEMRRVSESVPVAGDWDGDTWNEFNRLVGKFEKAVSNYQTEFVNLDASSGKLSSQQELLVDNFDNLQEQYSDIENVDMVDAITSFIWAEYCYNAALKVGNSILSESLMDYLR